MKRRRGYSLIECLVTIALIGTAMTTVAVSMSGMHLACQRVREDSLDEMEFQRLAVQLRADAHEALSAQPESGADTTLPAGTLRLALSDDEVVQYTVSADAVQREHRRNEEILDRETYRLPAACAAQWKLEAGNPLAVVTLQLEPEPVDLGCRAGCRDLQVTAAVGLLRRPAAKAKSDGKS